MIHTRFGPVWLRRPREVEVITSSTDKEVRTVQKGWLATRLEMKPGSELHLKYLHLVKQSMLVASYKLKLQDISVAHWIDENTGSQPSPARLAEMELSLKQKLQAMLDGTVSVPLRRASKSSTQLQKPHLVQKRYLLVKTSKHALWYKHRYATLGLGMMTVYKTDEEPHEATRRRLYDLREAICKFEGEDMKGLAEPFLPHYPARVRLQLLERPWGPVFLYSKDASEARMLECSIRMSKYLVNAADREALARVLVGRVTSMRLYKGWQALSKYFKELEDTRRLISGFAMRFDKLNLCWGYNKLRLVYLMKTYRAKMYSLMMQKDSVQHLPSTAALGKVENSVEQMLWYEDQGAPLLGISSHMKEVKTLYQRIKVSPGGVFVLERWLPFQDLVMDLLVTFGEDGLIYSSDVWWARISISLIAGTYIVWFILTFPIMHKVIIKKLEANSPGASNVVLSFVSASIWLFIGIPALIFSDLMAMAVYPTSAPPYGWMANIIRLRTVTETLCESPGQALLQTRMLYVKVATHRSKMTMRKCMALVVSITTSLLCFALTCKDIYDLSVAQEITLCESIKDLLLVGLDLKAPLLQILKAKPVVDYRNEGRLTDEHVRQISMVLPSCNGLKEIHFGSSNSISPDGMEDLARAMFELIRVNDEVAFIFWVDAGSMEGHITFTSKRIWIEKCTGAELALALNFGLRFGVESLILDGLTNRSPISGAESMITPDSSVEAKSPARVQSIEVWNMDAKMMTMVGSLFKAYPVESESLDLRNVTLSKESVILLAPYLRKGNVSAEQLSFTPMVFTIEDDADLYFSCVPKLLQRTSTASILFKSENGGIFDMSCAEEIPHLVVANATAADLAWLGKLPVKAFELLNPRLSWSSARAFVEHAAVKAKASAFALLVTCDGDHGLLNARFQRRVWLPHVGAVGNAGGTMFKTNSSLSLPSPHRKGRNQAASFKMLPASLPIRLDIDIGCSNTEQDEHFADSQVSCGLDGQDDFKYHILLHAFSRQQTSLQLQFTLTDDKAEMLIKSDWLKDGLASYRHAVKQAMMLASEQIKLFDASDLSGYAKGRAQIEANIESLLQGKTTVILSSQQKGERAERLPGNRSDRRRHLLIVLEGLLGSPLRKWFIIDNGDLIVYAGEHSNSQIEAVYSLKNATCFYEDRGTSRLPKWEGGFQQRLRVICQERELESRSPLFLYVKDQATIHRMRRAFTLAKVLPADNDRRALKVTIGRAVTASLVKAWSALMTCSKSVHQIQGSR
eukprot:TRINITY_DN39884_c0_g1_i1.p1 TRINITY_DN39884_c0_g1~~TRINITY_DN39884_c0_g1_i1.p1  ORF type:complete len:1256 (+),score=176.65 TRINITY_DN39884_c0_g1_i1:80-3847(+)